MTHDKENSSGRPVTPGDADYPPRIEHEGQFVTLRPVDAARDVDALYEVSHGTADNEALWTHLPYGPFAAKSDLLAELERRETVEDIVFFTVVDAATEQPVGQFSYLRIKPATRTIKIGHIWYGPIAQRTKINTEAVYLTLKHAFEDLNYRRMEWKCDALNERSRAAALRLGFTFEGIFRQHMIVKGRNRDSAWFAMLDHEWPAVKANMERWLYDDGDGKLSLTALNSNA